MTDSQTDFSPKLSLPFLLPAQAQKHVTVNEALGVLDALIMCAVRRSNLDTPPQDLADGDAFLVSSSPTGLWAGKAGKLAVWADAAWRFYTPQIGWRIWDSTEYTLLVYDGEAWRALSGDLACTPAVFGVNTEPDPVNRLAVKSDAILLSHDDVTPGSGDLRAVMNKRDAAATASIIFQTGWSARAEIGLAGDEDLALRVSPNGTDWTDGLRFNASSGHAGIGAMPNATDKLVVGGQLTTASDSGSISLSPNGRIDIHNENAGSIFVRALSAGSRIHFGATDSGGTRYNNAWVIHANAGQLQAGFSIVPGSGATIDLGSSSRPFRNCYLTNAPVISSDARNKENVAAFDAGLELIEALNPVTFTRPGDSQTRHVGLIAQHVRAALKDAEAENLAIWSLSDPSDAESPQAVSYTELVPVLIDAVRELAERVQDLEALTR